MQEGTEYVLGGQASCQVSRSKDLQLIRSVALGVQAWKVNVL